MDLDHNRACKMCKRSVKWYEDNINTSKTAVEVQQVSLRFCDVLNSNFQAVCKTFYNTIGLDVIKAILNKEEPKKVCELLHYCRPKTTSAITQGTPITSLSNNPKEACRICKIAVKYYEHIINKSVTPGFIQNISIESCKLFKEPVQSQCIQFYKGPGLELIKAILKSEDPKKVCQIIKLCLKSDINSLFMEFFSKNFQNPILDLSTTKACKMCMLSVKWYEDNINTSKTAVEVQRVSLRFCDILNPREQRFCKIFYTTIGMDVIKGILKKECPKRVCHIIYYCHRRSSENVTNTVAELAKDIPTEPSESDNRKACRICKKIVERYEHMINKSQCPESVQKQFINICGIFNANVKTQCIKFYNGPGLEVIKAILKSEDPKKVCQIIKLCLKSESYSQYLELFEFDFPTESLDRNSKRACKMCIKSVQWYEKEINSSKTAVEVQTVFIGFCGIFKHRTKNFCIFFYSTIGLEVIEGILKKKDPKKICQIMYYCRHKASDEEKSIQDFSEKGNPLVVRDETLKKVNSICSVLSSPLKDSCIKIISLKSQEIIDKLMKSEHLEDLYEVIKKYYKEKLDSFKKNIFSKEHVENPLECMVCKEIMRELEKILVRNPTEEKIKKALGKVCNVFHGKLKKECQKFIQKYSGKIVKYLLRNYAPKQICRLLQLCSNDLSSEDVKIIDILLYGENTSNKSTGKKETKDIKEKEIKKDGANPVECFVCKEVIREIERLIENKKSKEEIEEALKKVCHVLPDHLKHECENFVDKYGDRIVEFIMNNVLTSKICSSLHLCSTNDDTLYYVPKSNYL